MSCQPTQQRAEAYFPWCLQDAQNKTTSEVPRGYEEGRRLCAAWLSLEVSCALARCPPRAAWGSCRLPVERFSALNPKGCSELPTHVHITLGDAAACGPWVALCCMTAPPGAPCRPLAPSSPPQLTDNAPVYPVSNPLLCLPTVDNLPDHPSRADLVTSNPENLQWFPNTWGIGFKYPYLTPPAS